MVRRTLTAVMTVGLMHLTLTSHHAHAGGKLGDHSIWLELKEQIFPGETLQDGAHLMTMQSPMRALDAAIVPISIRFKNPETIKNLSLVIDHNPAPFAMKLYSDSTHESPNVDVRIRIDSYTYLRAVAETKTGEFFEIANFIKAAGGCSAPSLSGMAEAEKHMGEMKMKFIEQDTNGMVKAQFLIRHPNYSGFQFDQISRSEIPAHYIDSVIITSNGKTLFRVEPSVSMSENPHFTFFYKGDDIGKTIDVLATDSEGKIYQRHWDVPPSLPEVVVKPFTIKGQSI
ncbi:MAG: quinoprotein dehydrogenase-associated SoxYZ-like carrier [Alphaproteobacteria bacterium GM7ARS4]|nr:quinoprotein dehydrogenase-associated SoxYZ-like carrier [Alphaproteobacteria bacterium GM7ARS4]